MPGPNFIGGFQLEGGISNIQVKQNGSSSTSLSYTCAPVSCSPTGIESSDANDTLANRWLVSALMKFGFLVDPNDLFYAIGGWTYGNFEYAVSGSAIYGGFTPTIIGGQTFGLNGGTVGAGFERRIGGNWALKAEYRYTKFQNKTVNFPYNLNFSTTGENYSSPSNTSSAFSADMQTVLLGVTRYFSTY